MSEELPQMPEPAHCDVDAATQAGEYRFYTTSQMTAYALSARAPLEAENRRLRAELEGARKEIKRLAEFEWMYKDLSK